MYAIVPCFAEAVSSFRHRNEQRQLPVDEMDERFSAAVMANRLHAIIWHPGVKLNTAVISLKAFNA